MTRLYLYAAIGIAALVVLSGVALYFDHRGAARVQIKFDEFARQVEANGLKAKQEKEAQEKSWNDQIWKQEADYEKTLSDNRTRFATELARVRARGAAGGGVSKAAPAPAVCSDATGNQRLSDALVEFRSGIVGLLGACQENTDKLIACQGYVRTVYSPLPNGTVR